MLCFVNARSKCKLHATPKGRNLRGKNGTKKTIAEFWQPRDDSSTSRAAGIPSKRKERPVSRVQLKDKIKTKYSFYQGNTYILLSSFRSSHYPLPITHYPLSIIRQIQNSNKSKEPWDVVGDRPHTLPSYPNAYCSEKFTIKNKKSSHALLCWCNRVCAVKGAFPVFRHMSSSVTMKHNKNNMKQKSHHMSNGSLGTSRY